MADLSFSIAVKALTYQLMEELCIETKQKINLIQFVKFVLDMII